jgi:hypothetical protein
MADDIELAAALLRLKIAVHELRAEQTDDESGLTR